MVRLLIHERGQEVGGGAEETTTGLLRVRRLEAEAIRDSVKFAESKGRKIAGLLITNPDNPTGLTIAVEKQVSLAKAALEAGAAFVIFDWMYHYVTDESPRTAMRWWSPHPRAPAR